MNHRCVEATVDHGNAAAAKAVVAKSWSYKQRSYLHAGSLGTVAIALSFVLVLVILATTAVLVLLLCALFSRMSRLVTARTV